MWPASLFEFETPDVSHGVKYNLISFKVLRIIQSVIVVMYFLSFTTVNAANNNQGCEGLKSLLNFLLGTSLKKHPNR
jgi:hypothetical protein